MRVISLGFCFRVIVNEKPLNLEKTTSSVLSVLLLIFDLPRTAPTTIGIISFTGASAAQSQAALDKQKY